MDDFLTYADFESAAEAVRGRTRHRPFFGITLGSGLGGLADAVEAADTIPYAEIPGWPVATVEGHSGRLVVGQLEGKPVLVMQGRAHYYEGYSMNRIGLPIRVMQLLGVQAFIVTNAAGAVNPAFRPAELMLIRDHINLLGMAGQSPLRGPNDDRLGPRFPDMSQPYDPGLMGLARRVAGELGMALHEGIYTCLAGPSFETPADLRFLRAIGTDAVGMSTVPEVTVARHGGLRVLGISGITNAASLDGTNVTSHEEVLEASAAIVPKLTAIVRGVVRLA